MSIRVYDQTVIFASKIDPKLLPLSNLLVPKGIGERKGGGLINFQPFIAQCRGCEKDLY